MAQPRTLFAGEPTLACEGGQPGPAVDKFHEHNDSTRLQLSQKATSIAGEGYAEAALRVHDQFTSAILKADWAKNEPSCPRLSESQLIQIIKDYVDMLRRVYPGLVLDPHVLTDKAFQDSGEEGQSSQLHDLRLLQRRFLVYRSSPCTGAHSAWDTALSSMWRHAQDCLSAAGQGDKLMYSAVQSSEDALQFSCHLQDAKWENGVVTKDPVPDEACPTDEISASGSGIRQGRLYFTDGTCPNYAEAGKPMYLPGLSCAFNDATNAVLPPPLRSSRGDSLLRFMRVESTGVASFTLFAPLGPGTGLTSFHQETKQRRSFNMGTGDFIIQPLAVASHVRRLERVHGAVVGTHARHANLLPLEMYLEEGIPLVLYVRDSHNAEMVELPEQSCHAFISFATAHGSATCPPSIKASCNDWCLRRELASAYLLERLVRACGRAGVGPGHPDDGADTWTESSYFPFFPSRTQHIAEGYIAPWMQPLDRHDLEQDEDPAARSWHLEVILVRTCEHLLDAVAGLQDADAAWAGERPSAPQALDALQDALPALHDLRSRTWPDAAIYGQGNKPDRKWKALGVNFTVEYMDDLIAKVSSMIAHPPGNPKDIECVISCPGSSALAGKTDAAPASGPTDLKRGPGAAAQKKQPGPKRAKRAASSAAGSALPVLAPLPNGMPADALGPDASGGKPALVHEPAVAPSSKTGSRTATRSPGEQPAPAPKHTGVWQQYWAASPGDREAIMQAADSLGAKELAGLDLPQLRQHWLLSLQRQAECAEQVAALAKRRAPAAARRAAADAMGAAFRHRCMLETCMDDACCNLVQAHTHDWCPPSSQ